MQRDPKSDAAYIHQREAALQELRGERKPVRWGWAEGIKVRRVRWLWDARVPQGEITLIGGREGTGKSTVMLDVASQLSRGRLEGEHDGQAHTSLISATEDTWEHTIAPRLLAAGADVSKVGWVAAEEEDGIVLPEDIEGLAAAVQESGAKLLVLDPLISRLGKLDTHRDADVRQALEPLKKLAGTTGLAIAGLIHFNKNSDADPNTQFMGSRAFTAVPRSLLVACHDPDDETGNSRLLAQSKNSLGRLARTQAYTIGERQVGDDDGPVMGSYVHWDGTDDRNVYEIFRKGKVAGDKKASVADTLRDFLDRMGPTPKGNVVVALCSQLDCSERAVERAAKELGIKSLAVNGGPATWELP